jgi:hypothetical protein
LPRIWSIASADRCASGWEGGWRVPAFVRWPGKFEAGTVLNGIVSHQDWLPTLLAAAGEPDVSAKLLKGHKAGDKTFKVHIDGLNMLPYLTGKAKDSPRRVFFYISDDGDILVIRMRRDPFERADENSNTYWDWLISHAYIICAMQAVVAKQIEAFREFPPRQKPASFNLDAVLRDLEDANAGAQ